MRKLKEDEFIKKIHQKFYKCRVTKTMIMQIADELIQKPEITEEFIEEKAKEFLKKTYGKPIYPISVRDLTDFIRSLIKEKEEEKKR